MNKKTQKILCLGMSLFLALLMGSILFVLCGYSPVSVYTEILKGGLGSTGGLMTSLSQATPILFTGLAFIVSVKGGIVNLGAEGQLYAGAITAAIIGAYVDGLSPILHVSLALIGACLVSGLWGALIAGLKIKFGSNEIITAIMLNFIMQSFTSYLVNYPIKAEGSVGQTESVLDSAKLMMVSDKYQLSIGILIAVAMTVLMYIVFKKTKLGFEMTVAGKNMKAAKTAGIKTGRTLLTTMFLSGAIAGLAGATMILGVSHRFIDGFSAGYGFDGIAVASLAGGNILGVLISGLLFGVLRSGAMVVNRIAKIPFDFVMVIQALVIVFIAAPKLSEAIIMQIQKVMPRRKEKCKNQSH